MSPWSREKIEKAAQEVADQLMLVEHVKVLQQGQKQMADAIALIDGRLRQIEGAMPRLSEIPPFAVLMVWTRFLPACRTRSVTPCFRSSSLGVSK